MSPSETDRQAVETQEVVVEPSADESQSFSLRRRSGQRTRFILNLLLLLYILFVVNGIAFRNPGRIDFTEEKIHSLSPETREVLKLVTKEIRVVFPYYVQLNNSKQMAHYRSLQRAIELLKIYSSEQPLIRVAAEVNSLVDASRWELVREEYDLSSRQFNRLIFHTGEGKGLRQTVMPEDVATFTANPSSPSEPMQISSFRAEEAMTAAIKRLIHRKRLRCYFTQGHGEFQLGGASPMMALRHDLEASGFAIAPLDLGQLRRVPEDCDLLVIAGAEKSFTQAELDAVQGYLSGGGKLFVTLGVRRSKLESVLEKWGVEVLEGKVRSRITVLEDYSDRSWVVCRSANSIHPVTAPLVAGSDGRRVDFGVGLLEPRPLKAVGAPFRLASDVLLSTGGSDKVERYYLVGGGSSGSGVSEEARSDFTVAAATRQEKIDRPPENWVPLATRLVVLGSGSLLLDSSSRGGGFLNGNHRDFVMNCVNWLVEREELVSEGGVRSQERRIDLAGNPSLRRFVFLAAVLIFPGIFLALGVCVYFLRRS